MYRCDWINAYTKLNNKLNKKSPLTSDEIEELNELVQQLKDYIDKIGYEVLKRQ